VERAESINCMVTPMRLERETAALDELLTEMRRPLAEVEREGADEGAVRAALALLRGTGGR
jgi:hypothetical protein